MSDDSNGVRADIKQILDLQWQSAKLQGEHTAQLRSYGESLRELKADQDSLIAEAKRTNSRLTTLEATCSNRGERCRGRFGRVEAAINRTCEESGRWAVAEIKRSERERLFASAAKRIAKVVGAVIITAGGAGGMWAILNAACGAAGG